MKLQKIGLAAIGLCAAMSVMAADAVTDAMTAAYAPYRVALFRTNSNAQAESEQAIAQARQSWQALMDQFASRPAPYDRDARFADSLAQVAAVYNAAELQIKGRNLAQAHETLEKARDLMAELRRRNGVITYSDHMNAYHGVMEHVLSEAPKQMGEAQGMLLLMASVGTLDFLAGRLRTEAPARVAADPAFAPALQAVETSLLALRQAVLQQNVTLVRVALDNLKKPYSQLFLKFG